MNKLSQIILALVFVSLPVMVHANKAGVVVRSLDGQEKTACVDFKEDSISGIELLKRAGYKPILKNNFVTSINDEVAKDFNQPGSGDDYWSYWLNNSSTWRYSPVGGAGRKVRNGELDGWQRGGSQLNLSKSTFNDICSTQAEPKPVVTSISKNDSQSNETVENNKKETVEQSARSNKVNLNIPSKEVMEIKKNESVTINIKDNEGIKKEEEGNKIKENNSTSKEQKPIKVLSSQKDINIAIAALILLVTITAGFFTPRLLKRKKR